MELYAHIALLNHNYDILSLNYEIKCHMKSEDDFFNIIISTSYLIIS